ncbi:cupin domain-containing protein [Actinomadura rubrisoli]|uniref:Cupin domain-containing protein n=1 Tax=Actinomadura rubrisoli TaxID=2530368 RepID=A0A4R5C902_9ACTN|nr:cupin domain-containing protein [Actinomadura rubrisoli]TDD94660.1 cupin domain-containing protein [Actinomadura rubrisoli]
MSYPEARYHGEGGENSGVLRPGDTGPDLVIGASDSDRVHTGTRVHYLGTGGSTNGAFGLYRWEMGTRPSGPSPHFHRTITESFYILSGTVRLYDGKGWTDASPGDFLFVPEGGVHAFRNESGEPAAMLLLFTPGAPREGYFEELADIAETGRTLTGEEWTELYRRHDQYMV